MTTMPPVPPQNRSPKGPGIDPTTKPVNPALKEPENPEQVGQGGNIKQNTTNQGYQQDR